MNYYTYLPSFDLKKHNYFFFNVFSLEWVNISVFALVNLRFLLGFLLCLLCLPESDFHIYFGITCDTNRS